MTHIKTEQETDYNFDEPCPHCDEYVPIVIDDADTETYSVICPNCGRKMMLCVLCHWDADDAGYDEGCDWNPVRGCWRERGEKPWWVEGETS